MVPDRAFLQTDNFIDDTIVYDGLPDDDGARKILHICLNINAEYYPMAGVLATSIAENNRDLRLVFHVFLDTVDKEDLVKTETFVSTYKVKWCIYKMQPEPFAGFHLLHARYSHTGYFRIYMPKVMKEFTDRFLYLDADMLCLASMKPFLEVDFSGKPYGSCP